MLLIYRINPNPQLCHLVGLILHNILFHWINLRNNKFNIGLINYNILLYQLNQFVSHASQASVTWRNLVICHASCRQLTEEKLVTKFYFYRTCTTMQNLVLKWRKFSSLSRSSIGTDDDNFGSGCHAPRGVTNWMNWYSTLRSLINQSLIAKNK